MAAALREGAMKMAVQRVQAGGCEAEVPQEARREAAVHQDLEVVQQYLTRQPAGMNK